jgi:hypothetical protein
MPELKGDDAILYKCFLCGRSWSSKQSLRAHFKVHRNEGYMPTSFYAKKEPWADFKTMCRKHNSTTCQVLNSLIEACLTGEKQGLVNLAAKNPIVINVSHHFLGMPRSRVKVPVSRPEYDRLGGVSVETEGSPDSCALCGRAPAYECHSWPTEGNCVTTFLCAEHQKERRGALGGWIRLG